MVLASFANSFRWGLRPPLRQQMGPNRGASFRQGPGCPCAPSRKHALSAARFHWPVPPPSMWPSWRSPQPARRGAASSWSLRLGPTCQRGSVHIWGVRSHHGAPHPLFHPSHLVPDEPTHSCSTEQTGGETPRHKTGPPVSQREGRSHSTSGEDRRGKYFLLTSPRSEEGTGIWDIGNIKLQNVPRMRSAEMRQRQPSARNQPESIRLTPYYSNPSRMGLQAPLGLRRHCLVLRGPPQAELLGPGLRAAEPVPGAAGFGGHEGQLRPSP